MKRRRFLKSSLLAALALSFSPSPFKAFAGILKHIDLNSKDTLMRAIPKTGEKIPAMGLGTYQTFNVGKSPVIRSPIKEVLKLFYKTGGTVVDTSPMYDESERVIGDLTVEIKPKVKPFMATKVWTEGRENGIRQMRESMKLLRVDQIDLMQIHNLVDWKTQLRTLRQWKEEGLIRYIGITHSVPRAIDDLMELMKKEEMDFVQIMYSLQVRDIEQNLLPLAQDKGIAILANRPFEKAGMFKKVRGKEVPEWAGDFGTTTWAQFFLKYILAHPAVTCAIPATSRPKHLMDNMQAGFGRLPDKKERARMVSFFDSL